MNFFQTAFNDGVSRDDVLLGLDSPARAAASEDPCAIVALISRPLEALSSVHNPIELQAFKNSMRADWPLSIHFEYRDDITTTHAMAWHGKNAVSIFLPNVQQNCDLLRMGTSRFYQYTEQNNFDFNSSVTFENLNQSLLLKNKEVEVSFVKSLSSLNVGTLHLALDATDDLLETKAGSMASLIRNPKLFETEVEGYLDKQKIIDSYKAEIKNVKIVDVKINLGSNYYFDYLVKPNGVVELCQGECTREGCTLTYVDYRVDENNILNFTAKASSGTLWCSTDHKPC